MVPKLKDTDFRNIGENNLLLINSNELTVRKEYTLSSWSL